MATIGQKYSYATDAPLQKNYIGEAMDTVEQNQFKYRAEKRLEDEKIKAQKEKQQKELDDNLVNFQGKDVGIYNIDNVAHGAFTSMANSFAEAEMAMRKTSDPNEKTKLKLKQFNIQQQASGLKQSQQLFLDKYKQVLENSEKNIYNDEDMKDLVSDMQSFNNMGVRTDENGSLRFSTYEKDESGKATKVVLKDQDIQGVLGVMDRFGKSNYASFKTTFLANNKLSESDIQNGYNTETNREVDQRITDQASRAGVAVSAQDNEMYQKWMEMTGGEKKRTFTTEDRQKVAEYVANDLVKSYEDYYKKEVDLNAQIARDRLNNDKEKDKIQSETGQYNSDIFDAKSESEPSKGFIKKDKFYSQNISIEGDKFVVPRLGGKNGGDNNIVKSLGLNKEGKVFATGTRLKSTSSKFKVQKDGVFKIMTRPEVEKEAAKGNPSAIAELDSYNQGKSFEPFYEVLGSTDLESINATLKKDVKKELMLLNKEEIRALGSKPNKKAKPY